MSCPAAVRKRTTAGIVGMGDVGYRGVQKREEHRAREADWQVAMRPGQSR